MLVVVMSELLKPGSPANQLRLIVPLRFGSSVPTAGRPMGEPPWSYWKRPSRVSLVSAPGRQVMAGAMK